MAARTRKTRHDDFARERIQTTQLKFGEKKLALFGVGPGILREPYQPSSEYAVWAAWASDPLARRSAIGEGTLLADDGYPGF